jgi:transglutaminase-like putative cysteine protease
VTGYYEGTEPNTRKELHAWAEVFLPGVGWRGFDPTVGLAVADRHVALSAAPESQATAVVSGVFTAANKGSELETEVLFLDQPA